jgi:hypothetical protein
MRLFPSRTINLKSASAMPAALAQRPGEALERAQAAAAEILEAVERSREAIERGRETAAELVEAARAAMPIEVTVTRKRRRGRTTMTVAAVALTAAAATAAYVWWKRHDRIDDCRLDAVVADASRPDGADGTRCQ